MSKDSPNKKKDLFFSKRFLFIAAAILILVVSIILILNVFKDGTVENAVNNLVDGVIVGKDGEVRTVGISEIEEVVKRGHLYIAECVYNGYTTVYEDEETIKYYVAYEGKVKAGIDIEKINVRMSDNPYEIIIVLPEVEVEPTINAGTLDYIFMDEDYNTETVAQEAYQAAYDSLKERASNDKGIIEMATERAKSAEKAYVQPWLDSIDPEKKYTVKVLAYGEG